MFDWTEAEYAEKLAEQKEKNRQIEYRQSLKKEKEKYKKKKYETSKLLAIYLLLLLNAIVIYAMVAMWRFMDFSYLGVLITDIAAQVITYAIYCIKAYNGKKQMESNKLQRELSGICETQDGELQESIEG